MRKFIYVVNQLVLPAILAGYVYFIIKVILFKFGSVDVMYLWQQLQEVMEEPSRMQNRLMFANFVPFATINDYWGSMWSVHNFVNLFGNVAIFIPFGILSVFVLRKAGFLLILLLSFGFSLSLEAAQLVFAMGSFDVDDLILNTLGGVIGYVIAIFILFLMYGTTRKKKVKMESEVI